jgi:hypothetical protein
MRFIRGTLFLAFALAPLRAAAYYPQWTETLLQEMAGLRVFHQGDFNSDGRPDFLPFSGSAVTMATSRPDMRCSV